MHKTWKSLFSYSKENKMKTILILYRNPKVRAQALFVAKFPLRTKANLKRQQIPIPFTCQHLVRDRKSSKAPASTIDFSYRNISKLLTPPATLGEKLQLFIQTFSERSLSFRRLNIILIKGTRDSRNGFIAWSYFCNKWIMEWVKFCCIE